MEFRDAIKYLRSELGLTQMELASALHITSATVIRWEKGKNIPARSIKSAILELARSKGASKACIDILNNAILAASRERLELSGDGLYSVEHASLRQLVDDASYPIYVCDMETDELLYLNHKAEEMLGSSLDEMPSKECYKCIMHKEKLCEFCHKNELTAERFTCYEAQRPDDGVTYRVMGKLIQWNGRSAQVRYVLESDSGELLRSVLNGIDGGVSVIVPGENNSILHTYANSAFYRLYGYNKGDLSDEMPNLPDLILPDDREIVLDTVARIVRTHESETFDFHCRKRDGGVIRTHCSGSAMLLPGFGDAVLLTQVSDAEVLRKAAEIGSEVGKKRQAEQTDPMTGLLNHEAFVEKLNAILKLRGGDSVGALMIIDMDGFSKVNDHFGRAAGDATLIEIAQKLRDAFQEEDLLCRHGGDAFLIYLSDIQDRSAVCKRAEIVCAMLHKSFSLEVQLSASIGIAVCPDDGEDFDTLYRRAELALNYVKIKGKDGYDLYNAQMADTERCAREPDAERTPSMAGRSKPKRRMLIVEDNELNRDTLSAIFNEDFIIDTAAEGTAALTKLNRYGSGISVVLLDLKMPGMDGFTLLGKMRESVVMQTIPVVVVSGLDERETALEAIRSGASDFITKPVDVDLLRLRVASAISKSENEQLRAQNRYLALQNEEVKRLAEARRHSEELSTALLAAERADLAKSQFLARMSHEIRTPLNAVIGYNTIAQSEMSGAITEEERRHANMKVLDCLTKSDVASKHLLTIINDILDMSAIESGKMKVEHIPFDFRSLITSLTVMFFSQARSKGVDFEVEFKKPTEEWFVGDQMRINQILTNLLSNAVKFTPEGGKVTLSVTQQSIDEHSVGFRFVVTDTGIGMNEEYLRHIWTPFEQAEASISRRFGGTGLGLAITKNLVEMMGGTIDVKSESGAGSQFVVDLTLERTEQPDVFSAYDFSHINALVVDDDRSTCDYIKLLFDRCSASCTTVTSGERALEVFAEAKEQDKPFNVCIVDWRMPGIDGIETITRIKHIANRKLPTVVVTAYDFSEVAANANTLGIDRFLSKPLFQSSLFDLLANISGNSSSEDMHKNTVIDFDGARVLLVEDNNMNMEVAKRILLSAGLETDSAWNGKEAVDIFTASRPGTYKVVLMDIHMPEMDGYEATRSIRASKHPDAKTIPIIAMTADAFAEDVAEAKGAGMDDHVAKPIDIDNLFMTLSKYVRRVQA